MCAVAYLCWESCKYVYYLLDAPMGMRYFFQHFSLRFMVSKPSLLVSITVQGSSWEIPPPYGELDCCMFACKLINVVVCSLVVPAA